MLENQIDISYSFNPGFSVLKQFEGWKIGSLRFLEMYSFGGLKYFDKHLLTDESFILIQGKCALITGNFGEKPNNITFTELEKEKLYTVPKKLWHTHILSKDALAFVIENSETNAENSPKYTIDSFLQDELDKLRPYIPDVYL